MATDPQNPDSESLVVVQTTAASVQTTGGAMFMPLHVGRKVKIYPIQEHELESLNDLSGNTTLWTSVGSAALVLVIGCVWDMIQASQQTPKPPFNQAALGFTALCAVVAAVSFIVAHKYNSRKKTRLEKILSECIYAVDESSLKR